jgi:tetratricopeptide (TPR) repeat protein
VVVGVPNTYDLFVSYSHKDNSIGRIAAFVDAIQHEHLQHSPQKYQVFFDQSEIRTMDDWEHRILGGLRSSNLMVAMLSPNYFQSHYCHKEWETYLEHELDKSMDGGGIVPIYIEAVPTLEQPINSKTNTIWLEDLRRRQYIDLRLWRNNGSSTSQHKDDSLLIQKLEQDIFLKLGEAERVLSSSSNLPPHNRLFTGRVNELRILRQKVALQKIGAIVLIQGMTGNGKSALAFEYGHKFASDYPGGRFLMNCASVSDLIKVMKPLALNMEIPLTPEEEENDEVIALKVRAQLESRPSSLLIFDDVRDSRLLTPNIRTRLLPTNDKVHLIATTTLDPHQFSGLEVLLLGALPEDDSLRLLQKYRDFASEKEREAARRIVQRIQGFTWIVELIGVYLWQNPDDVSYNGFLERLESENLEAIEGVALEEIMLSRNDQKKISQVLLSTIDSLLSPAKLAVIFASLLVPERIPLPWLQSLVGIYEPYVLQQPPPGYPNQWVQIERHLFGLQLIHKSADDPHLVQMPRLLGEIATARYSSTSLDVLLKDIVKLAIVRGLANKVTIDGNRVNKPEFNWWEVDAVRQLASMLMEKKYAIAYLLADVAAKMLPWDNSYNEPMQRRIVSGREDMEIVSQLGDKFFAEAYFKLSETLIVKDRFDEAKELVQQAITLTQNSSNPDKVLLLDKYSLQLEFIDGMEAQNQVAINKMRHGYQDKLVELGPSHPEVISWAEWLKEHDSVWLEDFTRSQVHMKEPVDVVNLKEAMECDQYLHESFVREQKKLGLPSFDEARVRELLAKLAYQMRRPRNQQPIVLESSDIEKTLSLGSELKIFLNLAQKMYVLICTPDGRFRYKDLTLRDYCAVPEIIKFLDRDYVDMGLMRDRAMNALKEIGPVAVPALLDALRHEQSDVNSGAALILRDIGSPAIPSLLKALHHNSANVRRWVTSALCSFDNANAGLQELLNVLHDQEISVRIGAINALGESKNPRAIPDLIESLNDTSGFVSLFAAQALTKIGTPEALKAVEEHQHRKDPHSG